MKRKMVLLTGLIYAIVVVGIIAITSLLAKQITMKLVLSLGFVILAFTVLCGLTCFAMLDNRQNIMQNNTMLLLAAGYLITDILITVIINFLRFSIKGMIIAELSVMIIGITAILWAYRGKKYIENQ